MSSYTKAEPKIELKRLLNESRVVNDADLIAISVYTQGIYVIIKCTHLLQVDQGIMPLKNNSVIDSITFHAALSMARCPLVFSSSYLDMEPYRDAILTFKQKVEELNK